ncbi:MAG: hypothetical protein ACTSXP_06440 [Promethearchaeota archaeon]
MGNIYKSLPGPGGVPGAPESPVIRGTGSGNRPEPRPFIRIELRSPTE